MEYHGICLSEKILCIIFILTELQRPWQTSTTMKQKIAARDISFKYILVKRCGWTAQRGDGYCITSDNIICFMVSKCTRIYTFGLEKPIFVWKNHEIIMEWPPTNIK